MEHKTYQVGYQHQFSITFLHPKYWGIWAGIFLLILFAYVPYRVRDKVATYIGKLVTFYLKKRQKKQYHRADVNLRYCFPEWSADKRADVIEKMFITVSQTMLAIGETTIRPISHLQKRSEFYGLDYVKNARANGKNVILLVPHSWSVDTAGVIMHTLGMPMTGMYHPHRNPLIDWLWNRTRERFGGRMHARQNGLKPFLTDVRKGELGYFLPDEDYGEEHSVYVDFFATEKATLPGLNRMAKVANAEVIPMFPIYNAEKGMYQIEILPPLVFNGSLEQAAREMNKAIEYFVAKNPEQYVWILRLLKTRREGEDIYQLNP